MRVVRLAIADPPYPPHIGVGGLTPRASRWYGDQAHTLGRGAYASDFDASAGEWDDPVRHRQLLEHLVMNFDGFAIATTPDGIEAYRPLPEPLKIMAWVKPNAMPGPSRLHAKWEVVLLYPPEGRRTSRGGIGCVPDVLIAPKRNDGFAGAKPEAWTSWVLDALSFDPDVDQVVDMFPGSNAVTNAISQRPIIFLPIDDFDDNPPTDPNANADQARDWQGEWERDVAASGDTDFNTQTTEEA